MTAVDKYTKTVDKYTNTVDKRGTEDKRHRGQEAQRTRLSPDE